MLHDKELCYRKDPDAPTMGSKIYMRKMWQCFMNKDVGAEALVVKDSCEEPTLAWVEAVTKSRSVISNRKGLSELLDIDGICSSAISWL